MLVMLVNANVFVVDFEHIQHNIHHIIFAFTYNFKQVLVR